MWLSDSVTVLKLKHPLHSSKLESTMEITYRWSEIRTEIWKSTR
jgi:hypothetical protein